MLQDRRDGDGPHDRCACQELREAHPPAVTKLGQELNLPYRKWNLRVAIRQELLFISTIDKPFNMVLCR
jgi:hypothetical protein